MKRGKKLMVLIFAAAQICMLASCGSGNAGQGGSEGEEKDLFAALKKEEDGEVYVDDDNLAITGYISIENITEEETYYDLDEDIVIQVNVGYRGGGHDEIYLKVEYDDQVDGVINNAQIKLMQMIPIDLTDGKYLIKKADYDDYMKGITESPFPEDGSHMIDVTLDKSVLFSDSEANRVGFCLSLEEELGPYIGEAGNITEIIPSIILEKTESQIIVKEPNYDNE